MRHCGRVMKKLACAIIPHSICFIRCPDTCKLLTCTCLDELFIVYSHNIRSHTNTKTQKRKTQTNACAESQLDREAGNLIKCRHKTGLTHMQTPSYPSGMCCKQTHTHTHNDNISTLTSEMPTDTLGTRGSVWFICCKMLT